MGATSCSIGVDVGGTHTRVGLVDPGGALVEAHKWPTPAGAGDLLDSIGDRISTLAGKRRRPRAIGLAVPGALDNEQSMILRAVNLPFLENVPLREELSRRTGLPVVMETDVAAAAWGEYAGSRERPRRFVFVVVGTGIGAAAILDGKIVRHTHGGAGHLGQMIVDSSEDGPVGPCGTRGSLEACVSGPALERAARAAGLPASLARLEDGCLQGDAQALDVVNRAARFLAIGLVNVACLYAPDEIVVGGGAARVLPRLVTQAAALVKRLGGDVVPRYMAVRPAMLGDDAGMVGAALLAAERRPERSP